NSDAVNTAPTEPQIQKCCEFLAWWYDYKGFDPLSSASILNQAGTEWITLPRICGHKDVNPGGTTCPGNTLYALLPEIRTRTNQVITDCTTPTDQDPPSTAITTDRLWYNSSFQAAFSDADNPGGTGVKYSFYQIMDYNGTEWRANASTGFFNDNFSTAIHPDWTNNSGTWAINSGHLKQSNETSTNTNLYASLSQQSGNIYLYHWQQKISGSGSDRRSGMHFFCSDPTGTGRGNSYMVYLRADANTVQIYKYIDNSYSAAGAWYITEDFIIDPDIWYDVKVILNTITGEISVYVNDTLAASATDASPLASGTAISLRTGGCQTEYDDVKVYTSRGNSVTVVPANTANADIRYQSPSHSQEAGRIRSLLVDNAGNWSESVSKNVFVDWDMPASELPAPEPWYTDDFQVNINDLDNLSGVEKGFYSVSDFDGTRWGSNPERGFVSNSFDQTLGTEWTQQTGSWSIQSGALTQTDETLSNTNLWAYIRHDLSNRYLYEFDMKIDGSNANKRVGFHFFSDNPSLPNRGNGYFVWFRLQSQDLEFYKVTDDVFSLEKYYDINIVAGQWYHISIVYDRITGETYVYMNYSLVGEYKDPEPYASGNYISFRSGNAQLSLQNLRVSRSRYSDVTISVGSSSDDIRYQNTAPGLYAASLYSVAMDSAKNISEHEQQSMKIDWTAPAAVGNLCDGSAADIDLTQNLTQLSANWSASTDVNSGITAYYYAIGTSPGGTQLVNWTANGTNTSFTKTGLSLVPETTYYISVKALNGAGLYSDVSVSDGVKAIVVPVCPDDISVCADAAPFALSGASPAGGSYSGINVSGGVFNPASAGVGEYLIYYSLGSQSCSFIVSVNPLPVMDCPDNIYITINDDAFTLMEAYPSGGQFYYNDEQITVFDPAAFGVGNFEIFYKYITPQSNCQGVCSFFIFVYSDTQVTCPEDFGVCIGDSPFDLEGATPPGGTYYLYSEIVSVFDPSYWGIDEHVVEYVYNDASCQFTITVNGLPEVICPLDITLSQDDDPITLTGGMPEGGWYIVGWISATEFDPALYEPDYYDVTYNYYDPETGCFDFCLFGITVTQGVFSNTQSTGWFHLSPNPNNGIFSISLNKTALPIKIVIYSINGKIMYESNEICEFTGNTINFTSKLLPGMYFVKISNSEGSYTTKMVVE
nr:T9SS type A sorting domain-containing protein [Bacteroidales bacterium]